jgi:hypothetical protein
MSTHDEQAFTEALSIQAVGAGTPALTLDDVRDRARGIRRRRAAVGATGAAVLVAAAVLPVALLVGGGSTSDTLPPAGDPTVSDTANPAVEASYPPGWLVDGEIRSSDGTAFTPEVDGEISYVLRMGADRWVLGVEPKGRGLQVVVVSSTGSVLATYDALEGGLASDGTGTAVAWIGLDSRPRSLVAGAGEPLQWDGQLASGRTPPFPVQVLPGCDEQACEMVAELSGGTLGEAQTLVTAASDGEVATVGLPGLLRAFDVSPDGTLVSGYTAVDDERAEACSGVVEVATGELLWETCDASSLRFSPDGSTALGTDAYLDGFGQSFVQVFSAEDGQPLSRYEGGTVFDYRWADDESFLVSIQTNAGENLLLRVGVDGGDPEVLERVAGAPGDPEGMVRLTG